MFGTATVKLPGGYIAEIRHVNSDILRQSMVDSDIPFIQIFVAAPVKHSGENI